MGGMELLLLFFTNKVPPILVGENTNKKKLGDAEKCDYTCLRLVLVN